MEINRLIAEHGSWFYLIAFIWTFLEGETIVVFAGFAAAQGLLDPFLVLAATGLGSFVGDQTWFWIGRHWGSRLLNRFPRWRPGVDSALAWLERYNTGFILSFRFIYGVRNFSSFAMGMSAVHGRRFLALNFFAAALWAAGFVAIGYFLGHAFRAVLGDLARSLSLVALGAFVIVAWGIGLMNRLQRRRRPRAPSGAEIASPPSR
ncbi:MAG TPA: DedA family protein [Stellaceae bacterium]|jgi:membrane protein DedA with SNARE-associated domain